MLLKRIWAEYLIHYIPTTALGIACLIVFAAGTAGIAKQIEPLMDEAFLEGSQAALVKNAGIMFGIAMCLAVSSFGQQYILRAVGQKIITRVQMTLYDRMINGDMRHFDSENVGQSVSRFLVDASMLVAALTQTLVPLIKDSFTAVFLIAVLFWQDATMALIAVFVFPLAIWPMVRIGKSVRKNSKGIQERSGDLAAFLTDTLRGVRQIKAYSREDYESGRAKEVLLARQRIILKVMRISAMIRPAMEIVAGLAIAGAIYFGGTRVIEGEISSGVFFSFVTALLLSISPIRRLGKSNAELQNGLAAADRLFRAIDGLVPLSDKHQDVILNADPAHISLKNVSFSYPDGTVALKNVSLDVYPGQTVALVGSSGSGKSTILNLIPRFYDIDSGCIEINGQDIRSVGVESLRAAIGFVSQDTVLFDNSIRNNISYSKPGATEEQILDAAKKANVDEFVSNLPEGYATLTGENGARLSGGQRQRIAVARAFLRSAPILLLDEATSALDTEAERVVQSAVNALSSDCTTITVAHRLSTVINADKIYVIEDGEVAESGSHDELVAARGRYAHLYASQGNEHGLEKSSQVSGVEG